MDMVLCDFLKGAEEVLGTSFIKADKTKRWPTISAKKDFWVSLEWMPGSKKMWTFINKYDAHILSAYSTKDANSRKGKLDWLRKNAKLTQKSRIHLVMREDKQKYAMTRDGKPNLLIDDYIKNINEFKRDEILKRFNFASPYVELPKKLTVLQNLEIYGRLYGIENLNYRINE